MLHYITFFLCLLWYFQEHGGWFVIAFLVYIPKQPEVSMVTLYSIDWDVILRLTGGEEKQTEALKLNWSHQDDDDPSSPALYFLDGWIYAWCAGGEQLLALRNCSNPHFVWLVLIRLFSTLQHCTSWQRKSRKSHEIMLVCSNTTRRFKAKYDLFWFLYMKCKVSA